MLLSREVAQQFKELTFILCTIRLVQATTQSSMLENAVVGDSTVSHHKLQSYPWFCLNQTSQEITCTRPDVICFKNQIHLKIGFCATYSDTSDLVSMTSCRYFQRNNSLNTVIKHGYILLPNNISELNSFMCEPMNREGFLCVKCIDGFGPSATGYGYRCSNCSDSWYGVPLYIVLELIPITVFFFIIIVFRINLTSAPMTCFIMYSQLIVVAFLYRGGDAHFNEVMYTKDESIQPYAKVVLTLYGVWNLDFFRFIVPPFCISSKLNTIHIAYFGYISVFYPLFLTFLICLCIELHGRNFLPLVWIWRPFHRCFVQLRKGWDTKSDMINVFASFFLLSYGKSMYQLLLLLNCQHISKLEYNGSMYRELRTFVDASITCGSVRHGAFAIPAVIFFSVYNVLPALLLTLYPFKVFRTCISKCKLDGLALNTFIEKFQGCYRDGLDGSRDMRSFLGFYFFLRVLVSVFSSSFIFP